MLLLAIETSCDDASAAVLKGSTDTTILARPEVLSNILSSQIEFHKKYGGIVPEVAARKHVEVINVIIKEALDKAGITFQQLDTIAVTYGPGLVGSLLVGLSAAKALAWGLKIPLIGVNHLEGHIYANFLDLNFAALPNPFPFISLLVSGGHTMIVLVKDHGQYQVIGQTRDDAAGEAFDKVARFLGLGYPGGPIIDKLAKEGDPKAIKFTRPMLDDGYDFSFSGLKTAVVNYVNRLTIQGTKPLNELQTKDLVASFQQTVVDVLVEKAINAAKEYSCSVVTISGGVAANSQLRQELKAKGEATGLKVFVPAFAYCTDNAAMIGAAGYYKLIAGDTAAISYNLSPVASLRL